MVLSCLRWFSVCDSKKREMVKLLHSDRTHSVAVRLVVSFYVLYVPLPPPPPKKIGSILSGVETEEKIQISLCRFPSNGSFMHTEYYSLSLSQYFRPINFVHEAHQIGVFYPYTRWVLLKYTCHKHFPLLHEAIFSCDLKCNADENSEKSCRLHATRVQLISQRCEK